MSINDSLNPQFLAQCPVENGFRMRGVQMTRIEVFVDAAFAFALTMLVVAGNDVPKDFSEMIVALKGVPTFAATFLMIVMFWSAHRGWSRRFGLEDTVVVWLSFAFVFVMLIFVYPLRMVFSSMFHFFSAGWLPSEVTIETAWEMRLLFAVYGAGFFLLSLNVIALNAYALRMREALGLNAVEVHDTRAQINGWIGPAAIALLSVLIAVSVPAPAISLAGFVYFALPVIGPVVGVRMGRQRKALAS